MVPFDASLHARPQNTYEIGRFAILRLLGLVYFVAFLAFVRQAIPLIGHDGLLPADRMLPRLVERAGGPWHAFLELPTVFLAGVSDGALLTVGWVGVALSLAVLAGATNAVAMFVLWALYLSIAHVGQLFYGYGWENQLTETGFLAIFLCPLARLRPSTPTPAPVVWLFRWLIFRVMLGAGLIKLRGDSCWSDLTCLDFHFETQPIPNPLSPFFHHLPQWIHALGVVFTHVVESLAPFFVFGPRPARLGAGVAMLAFQITLILSGNLSFLNWLTIVPILACFDDAALRAVLPERLRARFPFVPVDARPPLGARVAAWGVLCVVVGLSVAPIANLLSRRQIMNTSHDPFELVNSYGAFGSIGRERDEIVIEGTSEPDPTTATAWRAYEFPCKPGDPTRRPCVVSPYHYRLDWQVWFAAMSTVEDEPWFVHLAWKLLHNDAGVRGLLANDPFPDAPPRWIRATLWHYEFAPSGDAAWWKRSNPREWMRPVSVDHEGLRKFLDAYDMLDGEGRRPESQPRP